MCGREIDEETRSGVGREIVRVERVRIRAVIWEKYIFDVW